jgi:hypothetical protein
MTSDDTTSKRKREDELDEALEESFPASDPPSTSVPGSGEEDPKGEKRDEDAKRRPADPGRPRRGSGGMPIRDE